MSRPQTPAELSLYEAMGRPSARDKKDMLSRFELLQRPTTSFTRLTTRGDKSPTEATMVELAAVSRARQTVMFAANAKLRHSRDSRMTPLNRGTGRSYGGKSISGLYMGGDFGLVPTNTAINRPKVDPVLRAKIALARKPEGWLVYETMVTKREMQMQAEVERIIEEEAEAERLAAVEAAKEEAAKAAAKAEEDRLMLERRLAQDAEIAKLKEEDCFELLEN